MFQCKVVVMYEVVVNYVTKEQHDDCRRSKTSTIMAGGLSPVTSLLLDHSTRLLNRTRYLGLCTYY